MSAMAKGLGNHRGCRSSASRATSSAAGRADNAEIKSFVQDKFDFQGEGVHKHAQDRCQRGRTASHTR